jgi:hypothetical protein
LRNRSDDGMDESLCLVAAVRTEPSLSNPASIGSDGGWMSKIKKNEST